MSPTRIDDKLLAWGADDIEPGTIEQAARSARLPFVHGHVALMPDAHFGIGATVGSVIPTQGAIIPAAVGVDIGCGMIAVETDATADRLPDDLGTLMPLVEDRVPAGVGQGHHRQSGTAERWLAAHQPRTELSRRRTATVLAQFGTLGSGNHFLEVCLDEREHVWVVLHSGSRGIGNQLAQEHIKVAKKLAEQWFIPLEDPDLAYLVQGTPEFGAYISDMHWSVVAQFELDGWWLARRLGRMTKRFTRRESCPKCGTPGVTVTYTQETDGAGNVAVEAPITAACPNPECQWHDQRTVED